MALLESKEFFLLTQVIALTMLLGCSERGGCAAVNRSEASPAYVSSSVYWVVDRVEGVDADGIAVLENPETLRAEERPVKGLPNGVEEGQLLAGGGALCIDDGEAAARVSKIEERFRRLKAD